MQFVNDKDDSALSGVRDKTQLTIYICDTGVDKNNTVDNLYM